jgi:deoxyhypusine synthase
MSQEKEDFEKFKENLKEVNQFKVNKETDITDLINSLKDTGFNAKRLAMGCSIYKKMVDDKE